MINQFKILTINHRTLNVDEIGHFVIKHQTMEVLRDVLTQLKSDFEIEEILYLNTCNRVAYIMYGADTEIEDHLESFFKVANPNLQERHLKHLHKYVQVYNGVDAIEHVFEMASSVDSLVIGEREIFRQFRKEYEWCRSQQFTGDNLRLLPKYTKLHGRLRRYVWLYSSNRTRCKLSYIL